VLRASALASTAIDPSDNSNVVTVKFRSLRCIDLFAWAFHECDFQSVDSGNITSGSIKIYGIQ
jgi:hypothetical protein